MTKMLVVPALFLAACMITEPDGLVLDENTATSVRGRLDLGTAPIHFEFERDGAAKTAAIATVDGAPLVEQLLAEDGVRTTQLLGGRLVIEAAPASVSNYVGDRQAEADLDAMPESAAVEVLTDRLLAAGIDREILPLPSSGKQSEISNYGISNACGSWNDPGEGSYCGTDFLGKTSIKIKNCTEQYRLGWFEGVLVNVPPKQEIVLFGQPITVCGIKDKSGSYWGGNVDFVNTSEARLWFGH